MKNIIRTIVLAAAVAALAALLLVGCQKGNTKDNLFKRRVIHIPTPIDTSKIDEELYEDKRV